MTTWTEIPNADIDQDSPVTQPLATAWRDNVRAAAEGASDAPVLSSGWHPYDMIDVGDGADGEIYDFATDGSVSTVESPDFEDGYEYLFVFESIGPSSISISAAVYRDVDDAYASAEFIVSGLTATDSYTGAVKIVLPRLAKFHHEFRWLTVMGNDTSSSVENTTDLVQFDATQQKINKVRFSGGFDGGRILMLRQREYLTG